MKNEPMMVVWPTLMSLHAMGASHAASTGNIPFTLADAEQDAAFLQGAKAAGLAGLKGHRAVGGMRASIYNAMPEAGVDALLDYMKEFVRTRG